MNVHYLECNQPFHNARPHVMAIGFFDGVHRGHQELFKEAKLQAKRLNVASSALTFSPHPNEVIFGENDRKYLTPLPHKIKKIATCGLDTTYVMKFDKDFASLPPLEFIERYIVDLQVKHVVVGFDFTFGFKAQGTTKVLKELAKEYGFGLSIIPKKTYGDLKISSTVTRQLVLDGKVEQIPPFLGEKYRVEMTVLERKEQNRFIVSVDDPFILPHAGTFEVDVFSHDQTCKAELSVQANDEHELLFKSVPCTYNDHTLTITVQFLQKLKVRHAVFV